MDTQISSKRRNTFWPGMMFVLGLLMLSFSLDAVADTRRFQMALFGSSDPNYTDMSWIGPGDPQPAAPRRSILAIDGIYQGLTTATLNSYGYDWSRIAAVVIDEPYWVAVGQTQDWSNPCYDGNDPRWPSINAVYSYLTGAASAVHSVSPSTKFWVNFSEPEIVWMADSNCSLAYFDQPYIDVISLDKYNAPFYWVQPYYDWLIANRPKQNQQFALVPGVFTQVAPSYGDPNAQVAILQGYFNYANNLNDDGWNNPMVWAIVGWPGTADAVDVGGGTLWAGIFNSASAPIADRWLAEHQKQRIDNMAGDLEVIDPYNGTFYGWAVDRTVAQPPYVDFWVDGQYWGGTVPSENRPDVGAVFDIYQAGYFFTIPAQFRDGGCHWVEAWVVAPEPWTGTYLMPAPNGSWFCYQ